MDNKIFKQIEDVICDRCSNGTTKKVSIVYARVDDDLDICTITGGNIFNMMYGISEVIKHMSRKTGAPTSLIIKSISDLLEV